jgi:hypothetical protein
MSSRFVALGLVVLLAACAGHKMRPDTAAIPTRIDVVKLERVASLGYTMSVPKDLEEAVEPQPSESDWAMVMAAKAAAIDQFENFGIHVVEDDSRRPDLRAKLWVQYLPHAVTSPGIWIYITVRGEDDNMLVREGASRRFGDNSLLAALLLPSRVERVQEVARRAVQRTVAVLQRGTREMPPADVQAGTDTGQGRPPL